MFGISKSTLVVVALALVAVAVAFRVPKARALLTGAAAV